MKKVSIQKIVQFFILSLIYFFLFSFKSQIAFGYHLTTNNTLVNYIKSKSEFSIDDFGIYIKYGENPKQVISKSGFIIKDLAKNDILLNVTENSDTKCVNLITSYGVTEIKCLSKKTKESSGSKKAFNKIIGGIVEKLKSGIFSDNNLEKKQGLNLLNFDTLIDKLRNYVFIILLIYTVIFGLKLATTNGDIVEILFFLVKMLVVMYFSCGIYIAPGIYENGTMLFLDGILIILDGLVNYSIGQKVGDYTYAFAEVFQYLEDHLLYIIENIGSSLRVKDFTGTLIGLIGIITIFILFVDVVNFYLITLLSMYFLAYISPIFVPTLLIKSLAKYFNNWLKFCLGLCLQVIVMGFFIKFIMYLINFSIFNSQTIQKCLNVMKEESNMNAVIKCMKNSAEINLDFHSFAGLITSIVVFLLCKNYIYDIIPNLVKGISLELPKMMKFEAKDPENNNNDIKSSNDLIQVTDLKNNSNNDLIQATDLNNNSNEEKNLNNISARPSVLSNNNLSNFDEKINNNDKSKDLDSEKNSELKPKLKPFHFKNSSDNSENASQSGGQISASKSNQFHFKNDSSDNDQIDVRPRSNSAPDKFGNNLSNLSNNDRSNGNFVPNNDDLKFKNKFASDKFKNNASILDNDDIRSRNDSKISDLSSISDYGDAMSRNDSSNLDQADAMSRRDSKISENDYGDAMSRRDSGINSINDSRNLDQMDAKSILDKTDQMDIKSNDQMDAKSTSQMDKKNSFNTIQSKSKAPKVVRQSIKSDSE